MIPNFLLIGPGRTGTSWVAKNLMLHPEIFVPRSKTTRFLTTNYDKGLDWYASHFKQRKAVGESIGGDIGDPEIFKRILRHMPDAKLIATFRNPVDRAYSAFGRLRALAGPGEENATIDFEDKLRTTPFLVQQGMYATHLRYLYSHFPSEQILIMFYDQLTDDPRAYLRKIYEFLSVDPEFESPLLNQKINATASVSAKSKVKKMLYRVFLRANLFRVAKGIDHSMRQKPVPLSSEVRQRVLESYFVDEIERLEQMLDLDLSNWKMLDTRKAS